MVFCCCRFSHHCFSRFVLSLSSNFCLVSGSQFLACCFATFLSFKLIIPGSWSSLISASTCFVFFFFHQLVLWYPLSYPLSLTSVLSVPLAFSFFYLSLLPSSLLLVTVFILLSLSFFSGFNFLSFVSHVLLAALLVSVHFIFSSVCPRSSL